MNPEAFVLLESTMSRRLADSLCGMIEELGVPVLLTHRNVPDPHEYGSTWFDVFVPVSHLDRFRRIKGTSLSPDVHSDGFRVAV